MNEKDNVLQLTPKDFKRALQAQDNPWRETDEYSIGDDGIFIRTIKTYKNGVEDVKWVQIHPFPLMPVEAVSMRDEEVFKSVYDDKDKKQVSSNDTKTHIKVKFLDLNGQESFVKIPQSELSQITKQSVLAKRWPLPPANKMSKVADIMLKVLADGRKTVVSPAGVEYEPCIISTSGSDNCGWDKGEHIRAGHPLYVGDEECMTFKAGSAEVQLDIFNNWFDKDLQQAFMGAYQQASYAFDIIYRANVNFILELTGKPGDGKSARLLGLSSVEGIPVKGMNRTYFDATASLAGLERHLPLLNNGYVLMDEFDKIVNNDGLKVATQMIFLIANGSQRIIAEANKTTTIRKNRPFKLGAIVASNTSIIERIKGHSSFMALKDRFIAIRTDDDEITGFRGDLTIINVWKRLLEENYGHIYGLTVDYISKNKNKLIEMFTTLQNELYEEDKHFTNDMRDAEMIAFLQLGAFLVSQVIGKEAGIAADKAVEIYKNRIINSTHHEEYNHKIVIERFKEWIADNIGSIRIEGPVYTGYGRSSEREQLDHAERLTNNAIMSNRGAIAGLEQTRRMEHRTDFEGCIWLKPEAEASLEKSGISLDELMLAAKELDLLPKSKKGEVNEKSKLSDQKTSWLAGVSKEELLDIRRKKELNKYNISTYAKCIYLSPFVEPEGQVKNEFEDEVFYSNVDRDDIDSLVEQNINAHMFDLPQID